MLIKGRYDVLFLWVWGGALIEEKGIFIYIDIYIYVGTVLICYDLLASGLLDQLGAGRGEDGGGHTQQVQQDEGQEQQQQQTIWC